MCRPIAGRDQGPEWDAIKSHFNTQNACARVLERYFPIDIPYRLIPRVDIAADDSRLAQKYPGVRQRRPESIEYAAVSAVGFDSAKTKALVYARVLTSGSFFFMEKRDGEWVNARHDVHGSHGEAWSLRSSRMRATLPSALTQNRRNSS